MVVNKPVGRRVKVSVRFYQSIYDRIESLAQTNEIEKTIFINHLLELGLTSFTQPPQVITAPPQDTSKLDQEIAIVEKVISKIEEAIDEGKNYEHVCEKCSKATDSLYRKKKIEEVTFCQSCGEQTNEAIPVRNKSDGDIYLFCPKCKQSGRYIEKLKILSASANYD